MHVEDKVLTSDDHGITVTYLNILKPLEANQKPCHSHMKRAHLPAVELPRTGGIFYFEEMKVWHPVAW